jgi:hypothetical protein
VAFRSGPEEDWDWVQRLLPLCSSDAFIPLVLHYYRYFRQSSAALERRP